MLGVNNSENGKAQSLFQIIVIPEFFIEMIYYAIQSYLKRI